MRRRVWESISGLVDFHLLVRSVDLNSGARGTDGVASQRWTSEAVAARFAEVAADLALSLRERDSLAARVRELEAERRDVEAEKREVEAEKGELEAEKRELEGEKRKLEGDRAPPDANSNASARKSSNTRRLLTA